MEVIVRGEKVGEGGEGGRKVRGKGLEVIVGGEVRGKEGRRLVGNNSE